MVSFGGDDIPFGVVFASLSVLFHAYICVCICLYMYACIQLEVVEICANFHFFFSQYEMLFIFLLYNYIKLFNIRYKT